MGELLGIFHVYKNFKLFLARLVGFVAIIYGAITKSPYFLFLGIAAVTLFGFSTDCHPWGLKRLNLIAIPTLNPNTMRLRLTIRSPGRLRCGA